MQKLVGIAAAVLVSSQAAQAQDSRASPPLPSFPQVYETADLKIRVEKVADGSRIRGASPGCRTATC